MAKQTLQQLYFGDEYNIMGEAVADFLRNGSQDVELRTGLELLIVKHTMMATMKMIKQGDFISELESEMKSLFLSAEV